MEPQESSTSLIPFAQLTVGHEAVNTVNGRDLHTFLGITKAYSTWIGTWIKRAHLVENRDYVVFSLEGRNPTGGRPAVEYHLTFDAAKCVGMMSGTTKGDEVRTYFLACEKLAVEHRDPVEKYPELRAIRELLLATAEARDEATLARHEASQAKSLAQHALDTQQWLTIREYCFLHALEHQLPPSYQQEYGRYLTGYCQEHGIPVRKQPIADRQYSSEHAYHVGTIDKTLSGWLLRRTGQTQLAVLRQ